MCFSHSLRALHFSNGFLTDVICLVFLGGRGFTLLLNPRSCDWDGRSFIEIFFFEISSKLHLSGALLQRVWIFICAPQWQHHPVQAPSP